MGRNGEEGDRLFSGAPGQDKRKWAQIQTQESHVNTRKYFCEDCETLVWQIAQRVYGVFLWGDTKIPSGQYVLGDNAWAEGLHQVNSRGHFQTKQFCDSATFSLQQLTSSVNYIQLKECWRTAFEQRFVSWRIFSVSLLFFSQPHYLRFTVLQLVQGFKKVVTNANS